MKRTNVVVQLVKPAPAAPGEPPQFTVINKRDWAFQVPAGVPSEVLTRARASFTKRFGKDYVIRSANTQGRGQVLLVAMEPKALTQKAGPDFAEFRRVLRRPPR